MAPIKPKTPKSPAAVESKPPLPSAPPIVSAPPPPPVVPLPPLPAAQTVYTGFAEGVALRVDKGLLPEGSVFVFGSVSRPGNVVFSRQQIEWILCLFGGGPHAIAKMILSGLELSK